MATDLSGLKNFRNKLQNFAKSSYGMLDEIATEIAIKGKDIAITEYAGVNDIIVSHETLGSGRSRVVVKGENIAYMEFGTGKVGEQSSYPKDKLPQSNVPITKNWIYYYPSQYKRTSSSGEQGWYHKFDGETKASFIKGQPAGMQMYRTSQRLKTQMADIARNKIKELT